MSNLDAKQKQREQIAKDIAEFQKQGGKIEKLPGFGQMISEKKHLSNFTKSKDKSPLEKKDD